MKRKAILINILFLLICVSARTQGLDFTLGYGMMNYHGDLQNNPFTLKLAKSAVTALVKYDFKNQFVGRFGLTYGIVYGDDKYNSSPQKERNLSFRTHIDEFQTVVEFHFNESNHRFSPYVFGGIAVFHFNPYTYDTLGASVFLKPLSTEGEGLPEYPDRKPYKLTQAAIPFGFGFNYYLNCMFSIGAEFTERKLFTDYLDDVSKGYIDYNTLLKERGSLAVRLAYRGIGIYPNDPNTAYHRGNPSHYDWYYTAMVTLTYHVNNCKARKNNSKNRNRCPYNLL